MRIARDMRSESSCPHLGPFRAYQKGLGTYTALIGYTGNKWPDTECGDHSEHTQVLIPFGHN